MNPWDFATTVYWEAGQKVRIGDVNNPNSAFVFGALEGATGTIGGIAFDHVIKSIWCDNQGPDHNCGLEVGHSGDHVSCTLWGIRRWKNRKRP
jgi:hypothetical protein